MSQQKTRPHITLLVGNPGSGKSALLNSLTGGANFKSGISIGSGVTQGMQIYKQSVHEWFADTPGFNDVKIREQAAAAIEEALTQGAEYTICFVVTLESGRLRPDDLTTMQRLLESITLPNGEIVKYGIIVNKLEPEVQELFKDEQNVKIFCAQLNLKGKGDFFSDSLFLCPFDSELHGKTDVVQPKNEKLEKFLSLLPRIVIEEDNVQRIECDCIEELCKEYKERTSKLEKDKKFLEEQMAEYTEKTKRFENSLSDLDRENRRLIQAITGVSSSSPFDLVQSSFSNYFENITSTDFCNTVLTVASFAVPGARHLVPDLQSADSKHFFKMCGLSSEDPIGEGVQKARDAGVDYVSSFLSEEMRPPTNNNPSSSSDSCTIS